MAGRTGETVGPARLRCDEGSTTEEDVHRWEEEEEEDEEDQKRTRDDAFREEWSPGDGDLLQSDRLINSVFCGGQRADCVVTGQFVSVHDQSYSGNCTDQNLCLLFSVDYFLW